MKITVKTLSAGTYELVLDAHANIRELRTKIANAMEMPWGSFILANLQDKDGNSLCAIFMDDPADEILVDFIRREVKKPNLQIEELTIIAVLNLGAGHYRPTKHNPRGISAYANFDLDHQNNFFRLTLQPDQKESFSARLERIGKSAADVPDHLQDPITAAVMDNPVIASNQRTFDLSSLERAKYIDPYSRQQLEEFTRPNLRLRSEIEDCVTEQEQRHANDDYRDEHDEKYVHPTTEKTLCAELKKADSLESHLKVIKKYIGYIKAQEAKKSCLSVSFCFSFFEKSYSNESRKNAAKQMRNYIQFLLKQDNVGDERARWENVRKHAFAFENGFLEKFHHQFYCRFITARSLSDSSRKGSVTKPRVSA